MIEQSWQQKLVRFPWLTAGESNVPLLPSASRQGYCTCYSKKAT
ncbi:hypothetical protein F444_03270 [Phytophthora nicotianae P1976]|uniref:Uncharacterized protein n=1 Tax=Phytophthora nicotianae P1976 TaxID=1317066 RepID=A0A081AUN4_PHYNI|nr:hypothetical protein F444_03270 [Phytophthora nicotianae P1976]